MAAHSNSAVDAQSKLLGLELVRFLCALSVLVWHYHHFAMIGDAAGMTRPHAPLKALLWPLYQFGLFGVQIFWCISGFIFYWKYADVVAARLVDARQFFWLRFSRLYPLHLVTLLAVAALQPLYVALAGQPFIFKDISPTSFLLQLSLADQWLGPRPMSFNGPIWSVSAEVFVYAGFFLLLRSFGKAKWLILAAISAALLSIWTKATSPALICAGYFFAGGAAAEWLGSTRAKRRPVEARLLALAMIGAAIGIAIVAGLDDIERRLPTLILAVAPPLLFLAAQDWRLLDRWQHMIRAAGNLTYSTYLVHFPMQLLVAIVVVKLGITLPVGSAWLLIAYLASAIIIGRLVFTRFEAPAQAVIRAATIGRRKVTAAA